MHFADGKRYRCAKCKQDFTIKTGTLFGESKLPLLTWFTAIYLLTASKKGISSVQLSEFLGVSQKTAWYIDHRVREAMKQRGGKLFGTVEVDETYIGGAWKNKAIHIRRQGSKRGRGTNKQCVFGIVCRAAQQARVWLVPNAQRRTLIPIIRSQTKIGSSVYTDGHKAYRILPKYGYVHEWVDHDAGEFVRGDVHTQTMDGFWGLLKTHLDSIGGIKGKNASYFVGEYLWRYNFRHLTRGEKINRIVDLLARIGGR